MPNDYAVKSKGIIKTSSTGIYPSIEALFGPWNSFEEFRTYLGSIILKTITDNDIPNGLEIGIKQSNNTLKRYKWTNPNDDDASWVLCDAVESVNGKTGAVTLSKSDIGLGNVENTTDANKNVNSAVKDGSGNNIASTYETKTDAQSKINALTKNSVGLGNVDNTADANKVVKGANEDGSGNVISTTYETKADATTKQTGLQTAISAIQTTVNNLVGLEGTNFAGFSVDTTEADALAAIPTKYTTDGYTNELVWYLVGDGIDNLKTYSYDGTNTPVLVSSKVYDFTDFSRVAADISTLRQDLDALGPKIEQVKAQINGSELNYEEGKKLTQGYVSSDPLYGITNYISYSQGNAVQWCWGSGTHDVYLLFYDGNKTYITGAYWKANLSNGIRDISSSEVAQYASNAAYIRATFVLAAESPYVKIGGIDAWTKAEEVEGVNTKINKIEESLNTLEEDVDEKIDTLKEGRPQNYVGGKYLNEISSTVKEVDDANWGITDFIPYTAGNSVTWKFLADGDANNVIIAFYNSAKQWIDGAFWRGRASTGSTGEREIPASDINTYAPNAAYIRASFKLNDDSCYVKVGNTTVWEQQDEILGLRMLQNQINEIKEQGADSSDIVTLNKFKESAISGVAAKVGSQSPKVKANYLCVLHISDIHGDATRMARAISFANSNPHISAIIATGDFSESEWTSTGFETTFTELYQNANVPLLPVIGNHDVGLSQKIYITNPNTNDAVGARFITPFMTNLGCVQGGENAGYYYKDFTTFNVRLIVLNEYEKPRVANDGGTQLKYSIWGRYMSQSQANWLVQTLSSVSDGWHVVIAMHQLIDVFTKYDNEFKGAINYDSGDVADSQNGMIQDIVDAYISKGTLSKTYSVPNVDTSEIPDVSVSADFTNANGTFICYLNGHTHNDGTGQSSKATNKQVDINVTTGSANLSNQAVYDDLYRDNDTIAQDAFNLVAFDTTNNKIRVLRIGANVSMEMKRRDYALIPFV